MDSIKPHSATKKKERQEENNSITGKHGKGQTRNFKEHLEISQWRFKQVLQNHSPIILKAKTIFLSVLEKFQTPRQ